MIESHLPATSLAPTGSALAPIIPVSALNRLAREKLESAFPLCWVAGEISNLSYATSGHVYFSLKDSAAQVRCVMFRNRVQLLGWRLENGQHIEARVLVTLYEARGDFQLNIEAARKAGVGNLYEQYLQLKTKLENEGLFAAEHKRALPKFPRRIGIITSPQAAALRDVLTTFARRAPQVDLILYPVPVQGADAALHIAQAIDHANTRQECELLIVCRGGGSIEDLWAFNDEHLARRIRASQIPIITGIGHETDFCIADFAADQRAPTPTAAAELAAPERNALIAQLAAQRKVLQRQMEYTLQQTNQWLDGIARRLTHPAQRLVQQREQLQHLQHRLNGSLTQASLRGRQSLAQLKHRLHLARFDSAPPQRHLDALARRIHNVGQQQLSAQHRTLTRLAASLNHLNPDAIMARGYSLVTNTQGEILRSSQSLEPNDEITVCFHSGRVDATIRFVTKDVSVQPMQAVQSKPSQS